jgi:nucleoside-diphosphate-sugar epimerase
VVAICRTRLSSALLERSGVACRVGSLMRRDEARRLLEGADVVFDLALPTGPESEARRLNLQLISNAVAEVPSAARYVFASTYMALGMRRPGDAFDHRLISGTTYGARKRLLERHALEVGRAHSREIYVLRLGQVHGEMQAVSRHALAEMTDQPTQVPDGPSNTVFVSTIAEGLIGIAQGRERPGLYMMVSNPQWTWEELHRHFADKAGVAPDIVVVDAAPPTPGVPAALRTHGVSFLTDHRELLTAYVLPRLPDLEDRARAWHHVRSARAQIAQAGARMRRPYAGAYVGDAPGARLVSPTDSRRTVYAHLSRVREILRGLTR